MDDRKDKMHYYLQHSADANACAVKFKNYLESECSEEKYAITLWRMIAE